MPGELGGGEGNDEGIEDRPDQLEELRDEINEEYGEASEEGAGDNQNERQDDEERDEPPDQNRPSQQETNDIVQSEPEDSGDELGDFEQAKDSEGPEFAQVEGQEEDKGEVGLAETGEAGERDDELEKLRGEIGEQYEEPTHQDEEHTSAAEGEVDNDTRDGQDQQQTDDASDAFEDPEETHKGIGETDQEEAEKEAEPPGSEGSNGETQHLEELRAEINEQFGEAGADDESLDTTVKPEQDSGSEAPALEPIVEEVEQSGELEPGTLDAQVHFETLTQDDEDVSESLLGQPPRDPDYTIEEATDGGGSSGVEAEHDQRPQVEPEDRSAFPPGQESTESRDAEYEQPKEDTKGIPEVEPQPKTSGLDPALEETETGDPNSESVRRDQLPEAPSGLDSHLKGDYEKSGVKEEGTENEQLGPSVNEASQEAWRMPPSSNPIDGAPDSDEARPQYETVEPESKSTPPILEGIDGGGTSGTPLEAGPTQPEPPADREGELLPSLHPGEDFSGRSEHFDRIVVGNVAGEPEGLEPSTQREHVPRELAELTSPESQRNLLSDPGELSVDGANRGNNNEQGARVEVASVRGIDFPSSGTERVSRHTNTDEFLALRHSVSPENLRSPENRRVFSEVPPDEREEMLAPKKGNSEESKSSGLEGRSLTERSQQQKEETTREPNLGGYQAHDNAPVLRLGDSATADTRTESHSAAHAASFKEVTTPANQIVRKGVGESRGGQDAGEMKPTETRNDPHAPQERADLKQDATSARQIESREVLFLALSSKGGPSDFLRIPKEHTSQYEKGDILEARVARVTAPETEYRFYADSAFTVPHLNISHLNPNPREPFHVLSIEKYEISGFAGDFNHGRPKELGNVALVGSDGKLFLKVDTSLVEIKQPRLSADGGKAFLEGSLVDNRRIADIRISKQLEKFDIHLGDHTRVLFMKANGSNIEIGHRVGLREPDHRICKIPATLFEPRKEPRDTAVVNHRLLELDTSPMSRKEIRAWIDTEGSLDAPEFGGLRRGTTLQVTQKRREALDAYVEGVAALGVRCKVEKDAHGMYVAKTTDVEGIAKVISEVGPFRTPQRIEQTQKFMERLRADRKERRRVIERARKLLDL